MHKARSRPTKWPWPRPSERVRALIQRGAEIVLRAPPEWLDEIDRATLSADPAIADDPVLAAAVRRANRDNLLHWAAANVRDPGAPVPANTGPEPLGIARDLVRRGMTDAALNSYRAGHAAAWLRWMAIGFELTSDHPELRELLDVSARSISSFIDATIASISAQMFAERDELTRGTHAERREVVALVHDGAPINPESASQRLGYALGQVHRAAIVWSEDHEPDLSLLERAGDALARAVAAPRPLTVVASAATLWLWVPRAAEPDLDPLVLAVRQLPGVRVALGTVGRGVAGFRRSHYDAVTAQRMVARLGGGRRVVSFDDVRLVSLVTQDPERAEEFIAHALGALASAAPELRGALRTFLDEGCNASRASDRLHTHRNTLLRRLARAEALLPRPLDHARTQVAVALEILRWQNHDA